MRLPTAIVALALLAVAGVGYSQIPPPAIGLLPPPPHEVQLVPVLEQSAAPQEQSVEQMLDTVDALRLQKAILEKREKAIIEELNKKVEKQSERMRKLGIGSARPVEIQPLPPRIPAPPPSPSRPNLPD